MLRSHRCCGYPMVRVDVHGARATVGEWRCQVAQGLKKPKPFTVPKWMSEEELRAVVLPPPSAWSWEDEQGVRRCWSDGTGRMHVFPEDKRITGEVLIRYFESIGVPAEHSEECTVWEPCEKHRGALRGRNWRTGEYL